MSTNDSIREIDFKGWKIFISTKKNSLRVIVSGNGGSLSILPPKKWRKNKPLVRKIKQAVFA